MNYFPSLKSPPGTRSRLTQLPLDPPGLVRRAKQQGSRRNKPHTDLQTIPLRKDQMDFGLICFHVYSQYLNTIFVAVHGKLASLGDGREGKW